MTHARDFCSLQIQEKVPQRAPFLIFFILFQNGKSSFSSVAEKSAGAALTGGKGASVGGT